MSKTPEKNKSKGLEAQEQRYAQTGENKVNKDASSPLRQTIGG